MSWGTEPEWQPESLEVLAVEQPARDRAIVTTRERPFLGPADPDMPIEYRYVLRLSSGGWRLDSRSTIGLDGKTIGGLL
jgi:hypothetical protein